MWNRAELKGNAKSIMRRSYWTMFVVALLGGILSGTLLSNGADYTRSVSDVTDGFTYSTNFVVGRITSEFPLGNFLFSTFAVIAAMAVLIGFLYAVFIGNAIEYGVKHYFLDNEKQEGIPISTLFIAFKEDYWNIVKVMLVRNVKVFLWSLLFVIPGIIKSYEYQMIPYLLSEDSSMPMDEVFRRSREMTNGMKMSLFILDLSFIGWFILGAIACGIGTLFVNPYYEAVLAEAYLSLKEA